MKEIVLVRHAKSSWEFDVSDHERPIKSRGFKDIKLVSQAFDIQKFKPEKIVCSSAKRAQQTVQAFLEEAGFSSLEPEIHRQLYDFSGNDVIDFIKSLTDDYHKIMIFGHNHAFTSISNIFGNEPIDNVPTSGLVHLRFNIDSWKDLNKGQTLQTIFPRDLK
jgi:phosphohistidine phosphatase